jgi:hypothetical protein
VRRLELPTSRSQSARASQLRHTPASRELIALFVMYNPMAVCAEQGTLLYFFL